MRTISWAISSGDSTKSMNPLAIALPGMSGCFGGLELLGDGDAARLFDAAQRRRPIAVIARDDDGDQLAVPMLGQRAQEHRDHVGPAPRLRDRLEAERAVEHMQIALRRNDEHVIGLDEQPVGDQLDRHLGVARKKLMEPGGDDPQVIDDDDGDTHVGRQMVQQPDIGVEAAGGAADANHREVLRRTRRGGHRRGWPPRFWLDGQIMPQ